MLCCTLLAACATQHVRPRAPNADEVASTLPAGSKAIWQSGIQFVALQPQPAGAPPNDQPQKITAARLHNLFGQLRVTRHSKGKSRPLFSGSALDKLCPALSRAFSIARSHEDIAFSVVTRGQPPGQRMLLMHIQAPLITTGLVFYRKNHLNVIFGRIHAPFKAHYLNTGQMPDLRPGERGQASQSDWQVLEGQQAKHPHKGRFDWIRFTKSAQKPLVHHRDQVREKRKGKSEYQSIAHRLRVLDKLYRNGLITGKEYKEKRKQILNNL